MSVFFAVKRGIVITDKTSDKNIYKNTEVHSMKLAEALQERADLNKKIS